MDNRKMKNIKRREKVCAGIGTFLFLTGILLSGCGESNHTSLTAGRAEGESDTSGEMVAFVKGPVTCTPVEGPCRMVVGGTVQFEVED